MSRSKGTTLLELCFVLTIAGTLAAVAIPPISRAIDQLGLIAAAEQVRSGLHTARIWSIIHNRDCRLRVASRVTYVIECQTPEWLTIRTETLPRGFMLVANNKPEFHPRGNVAPMATITVWNRAGRPRRIIVNRTGRVRME